MGVVGGSSIDLTSSHSRSMIFDIKLSLLPYMYQDNNVHLISEPPSSKKDASKPLVAL
jgi:hypothetical protein